MSACDSGALTPVDQAIAALLECAPPPPGIEQVALSAAQGRVLAATIAAPADVPAWDNSAMDGYAVAAASVPAEGAWLSLASRIAAGATALEAVPAGQAARIFTGAPLPPGADAVVAQEDCRREGDQVWLPGVQPGAHVRRQGEELRKGTAVLGTGVRLGPAELGLLASLGQARLPVYRRLRVALLSSGDELAEPGEALAPGHIYNANRYSVGAVLEALGCEVLHQGIVADQPDLTRDALRRAAASSDVVVTSGGVSVGEEDHLKAAVRELGDLTLWRLAIQPGKPLAFGHIGDTPWLGLPGNPAAALVTALVVGRPFLLRAQGRAEVQARAINVPAGFDWLQARPRRQYLRARLAPGFHGQLRAVPHASQGSAMLTAAAWAEGLVVVEAGRTLEAGEAVPFLSYDSLLR